MRQALNRIGLLLGLLFGVVLPAAAYDAPLLAIVIDDLGDNRARGMAAVNLPGAITYAVLPHTPHARELAIRAHQLGKEVILHAPMENKSGLRLGPGALTRGQSPAELQHVLNGNLDVIPYVVGMNNHMGSMLTEQRGKMDPIMQVVKQRNLFFLDSVTTSDTVAWKVAHEYGIPYLVRDVFLDNQRNQAYIHNQFKQALSLAVNRGHAVLIGHPYPETVAYLNKVIPILQQLGVRLVTASELLNQRSRTQLILAQPTLDPCDHAEGHCDSLPVAAKR
ncbi:divergent polysaccharide deacetylase family protein [Neptuniibacter halophilus]|uniref:divergent polysaccharide deacetylase family protein n=1 Tax=Neptuniibacter halophilus TaxID=651666 RepID=UPI0025745D4A|nr:divergent polysaccharide deacetylase family protein [Neptuniibacter halophilus]